MYTAGMIASAAIFSFPRLCWMALTRGILALAIWSGFSVFQNGGETLAQVTSAYDFSEIKDLKSLAIRIDAYGGAFSSYHYSLSVHGDGLVEFDGHFSTFIPGLHRSHLSEAEVLRLLAAFREADFNSLRDESDLQVFDAPSIGIELSAEGFSGAHGQNPGNLSCSALAAGHPRHASGRARRHGKSQLDRRSRQECSDVGL